MMYRLAEIASYPGNPPTCTPIIAIEFPSNFLVGFPAFSSKAVLQKFWLRLRPFFRAGSRPSQRPPRPLVWAAAADCFKLELLNYWAGELLPARTGLP